MWATGNAYITGYCNQQVFQRVGSRQTEMFSYPSYISMILSHQPYFGGLSILSILSPALYLSDMVDEIKSFSFFEVLNTKNNKISVYFLH